MVITRVTPCHQHRPLPHTANMTTETASMMIETGDIDGGVGAGVGAEIDSGAGDRGHVHAPGAGDIAVGVVTVGGESGALTAGDMTSTGQTPVRMSPSG